MIAYTSPGRAAEPHDLPIVSPGEAGPSYLYNGLLMTFILLLIILILILTSPCLIPILPPLLAAGQRTNQ